MIFLALIIVVFIKMNPSVWVYIVAFLVIKFIKFVNEEDRKLQARRANTKRIAAEKIAKNIATKPGPTK